MDIDRLFSLEAEAGVLGSILLEPDCFPAIMGILPQTESFFRPEHQKIYTCLIWLFIEKQPIDAIALRTALKNNNWLEEVGDVEYIGRLLDSLPSAANAEYYARIVADKHIYREQVRTAEKIHKLIESTSDTKEIAAQMQSLVMNQAIAAESGYGRLNVQQTLDNITTPHSGISTGWRDIEYEFCPGDMVIVAGRPSMGKSAWCTCLAEHVAADGYGVLIISLEMRPDAITARMICRRARVNQRYATDIARPKLEEAAEELKAMPIYIAHNCDSLPAIAALVHRVKAMHGLDIVVLDYLQLLRGGKAENRNEELAQMSRTLKKIAMNEDVVMVIAAQLNRQVEMRTDHKPRMSDLRDSGAIEQDADYVLMLYRADYYRNSNDDKDGLAELICAKAREGETGTTQMVFIPEFCSFENLAVL
jgi:replicative DNA helicase